jgi:actin-related protein
MYSLERGYRYDFPEDDIHESVLSSLEPFYEAPEVFFHRSKASTSLSKELTLAEGLLETILACNPLIHQELVSNILLVGDLASIPGFGIRLQNELEVLFQTEGLKSLWKDVKVQILEHELYGYKGCCQHAEKIPSTMWITEEDYLVHGSDVLRKKCY